MRSTLRARRHSLGLLVFALTLSGPALWASAAPTPQTAALSSIRIDNFGVINDKSYRGAQPDPADFTALAKLGVKLVIDLQKDGEHAEQGLVERAGMKFVRIPMTTSDRPADAAVDQFLKLVIDPANQPVYVHCAGGRHRTGVMTAVYRMTQDNWTADQAYGEMKKFKFETLLGHPELKKFVFDYYTQLERTRAEKSR